MTGRPHLAIVGAGIAGLAAAHEALGRDIEVTVFDAAPRAGGKIRTTPFAGLDLDAGPDAFLTRVPWATTLCDELGLSDHLVSPAVRTARIWAHGALRPLPDGHVLGVPTDLDALSESGLVSAAGVERARCDLSMGHDPVDVGEREDESVGSLIRRRLGDEVLEGVVAPLIGGINAGDVDQLSLAAVAPQLAAAAAEGTSLIAALRDQRIRAQRSSDPAAPIFHSLTGGLGRLVGALTDRIGSDRLQLGAPVTNLRHEDGGVRLDVRDRSLRFDGVVVATPPDATANLITPAAPEAVALLRGIEFSSVVLVSLAYPDTAIPTPLEDSGFLVPHREQRFITACSWSSRKFTHLKAPDQTVLRVSAGRHHDARIEEFDDDRVIEMVREDLGVTMGIEAAPRQARLTRWPRSFPQYAVGHLARVDAIEANLDAQLPLVRLAGATLRGVGIPACIRSGREAARVLAGRMGHERP